MFNVHDLLLTSDRKGSFDYDFYADFRYKGCRDYDILTNFRWGDCCGY